MRTCLLVECLLVGLAGVLAVVTPLPGAEEKAAHFKLYYGHAGLTEISVEASKLPNEGSRLRYVWHTLRRHDGKGKALLREQSLSEYDRHQLDAWLTEREWGQFRDWVSRNKVFDLPKKYPSARQRPTYGSAFKSVLSVEQGDKKHAISWNGDSKIPAELSKAVGELLDLAKEVRKSRSR